MAVSLADTARWFLVTTAELVVLFLARWRTYLVESDMPLKKA